MLTALLSRADVSRHLQALHLLRELRDAFTARRTSPSVRTLEFEPAPSSILVRQATLEGLPAWSLTVRTREPKGTRAVLELHDAETGKLLALMDASHLTSLRANLVSALAADVLARPDARNVAVLGSGLAASGALKALRLVRSLQHVWFHEKNVAENFELAHRLGKTLSMAIHAADTVREAVEYADLVVLTGDVALGDLPLRPGTHVTVLNAEQFTEPPLSTELLSKARRFADVSEPSLPWARFDAELGEVLSGVKPGREHDEQLTVFASLGPAHLDLLTAWHVFEGARHDAALTRIDLEA